MSLPLRSVRELVSHPLRVVAAAMLLPACGFAAYEAKGDVALDSFKKEIQPLLRTYCYDCHGDGRKKGGVSLDGFDNDKELLDHDLWLRTLKNVRGGLMPPAGEPKVPEAAKSQMLGWIKSRAFSLDPEKPDPGKVTVRRLNRVEYRNTIRELLGVDYDTNDAFPADDSGSGFDNIADVLTISPMLLEKYLDAAQEVIDKSVPTQSRVVAESKVLGGALTLDGNTHAEVDEEGHSRKFVDLLYYKQARVGTAFDISVAGDYQVVVDLKAVEQYVDNVFDYNKCRVTIRDGVEVLLEQEFVREGFRSYSFVFDRKWEAGSHDISLEVTPLTFNEPQPRKLRIRVGSFTLRGPMAKEHWVQPARYTEFFPGLPPAEPEAQAEYARKALTAFATRAFRRPVEPEVAQRLVELAMATAEQPDTTLEAAIAQSMVAVLASPRFLFREDYILPTTANATYADIDDYSLASRLSYFLWSSMPDDTLLRLAARGELRGQLKDQVARMLRDERAGEFVRNFTGQWLQARDIPNVPIEGLAVHLRDHPNPEVEEAMETFRRLSSIAEDKRTPEENEALKSSRTIFFTFFRSGFTQLKPSLREAMQKETEMLFAKVLHEKRSALELLNARYAHLNEELAKHYEIEGVVGSEMREVALPPDSVRGGILTQGTVLAVTSNPTRTSPVKRGVFILDNVLGAPPPPPPPNIPPLEEAGTDEELKKLSLRETLALHARKTMCHSCHSRMDPLGLALENFNAMGRFREKELSMEIDPAGVLMTGERFKDVRELKQVLVTEHRRDFYYCLAEKLMTYALGRDPEFYDTETLDRLVDRIEAEGGRLDLLVSGIIESVPFQKRRVENAPVAKHPQNQNQPLAALESKL